MAIISGLYESFSKGKHLYKICTTTAQYLRRWRNIVEMFCKYFVFAEIELAFRGLITMTVTYVNFRRCLFNVVASFATVGQR